MLMRIGERDEESGLYYVLYPDGSQTLNGIKNFNSRYQKGDVVLATKRNDGMIILDNINAVKTIINPRLPVNESKAKGYLTGQIFNREQPVKENWLLINATARLAEGSTVKTTALGIFPDSYRPSDYVETPFARPLFGAFDPAIALDVLAVRNTNLIAYNKRGDFAYKTYDINPPLNVAATSREWKSRINLRAAANRYSDDTYFIIKDGDRTYRSIDAYDPANSKFPGVLVFAYSNTINTTVALIDLSKMLSTNIEISCSGGFNDSLNISAQVIASKEARPPVELPYPSFLRFFKASVRPPEYNYLDALSPLFDGDCLYLDPTTSDEYISILNYYSTATKATTDALITCNIAAKTTTIKYVK